MTVGPGPKRAYVAAVRALSRLVWSERVELGGHPTRGQTIRHHLRSLPAIYDAGALVELGVPWWSYRAIAAVDAWLASRPAPVRVFEYGAGASTVWLAARGSEVHSVEHDVAFAAVIGPLVAPLANVDLRVRPPVPATSPSGVRSGRSGYEHLDFADYVAEIDAVGGTFDLIVIDGRARSDALAASSPHLAPGGLIVFDNANRRRYQASIRASGLPVRSLRGLTPALPYPTTTALLGPQVS